MQTENRLKKFRVVPKGQVFLDVRIGVKGKTRAKFLVTDDVPSSRLSGRTSEELKFLSFKRELLVRSVLDVKALSKDVFLSEYNNVLLVVGMLEITRLSVQKEQYQDKMCLKLYPFH